MLKPESTNTNILLRPIIKLNAPRDRLGRCVRVKVRFDHQKLPLIRCLWLAEMERKL